MNIDWGKLTIQGRCKAPGISWTDEEMEARYKKGMTADEVRAGILKPEDRGKVKIESKEKLLKKAEKLGIKVDEDAVSVGDLKSEVEAKEKEKKVVEEPLKGMTWSALRKRAKAEGILKRSMSKQDVITAIKAKAKAEQGE